MEETPTPQKNKVSKSYSFDPEVIAWLSRKSNALTTTRLLQGKPKVSDSQLANRILVRAMRRDIRRLEAQNAAEKKVSA